MDLKMEQTSSNTPDTADEKQHNAVQDHVYIDPQEEKALLRKLDRWIVPPVMLLYLFSLVLPPQESPQKRPLMLTLSQYVSSSFF
jgi:hypothetical protein